MKTVCLFTAIALAAAPMALAQEPQEPVKKVWKLEEVGDTETPLEESEGFFAAEMLNRDIYDRNDAAQRLEENRQRNYEIEARSRQEQYAEELRDYMEDELAADQARADYERKNAEYQRELEASQRAREAHERAMADYQACLAGDQSRCAY